MRIFAINRTILSSIDGQYLGPIPFIIPAKVEINETLFQNFISLLISISYPAVSLFSNGIVS